MSFLHLFAVEAGKLCAPLKYFASVALILCTLGCPAKKSGQLAITPNVIEAGSVENEEKILARFQLKNESGESIVVHSLQLSCGCTSVKSATGEDLITPFELPSGKTMIVVAEIVGTPPYGTHQVSLMLIDRDGLSLCRGQVKYDVLPGPVVVPSILTYDIASSSNDIRFVVGGPRDEIAAIERVEFSSPNFSYSLSALGRETEDRPYPSWVPYEVLKVCIDSEAAKSGTTSMKVFLEGHPNPKVCKIVVRDSGKLICVPDRIVVPSQGPFSAILSVYGVRSDADLVVDPPDIFETSVIRRTSKCLFFRISTEDIASRPADRHSKVLLTESSPQDTKRQVQVELVYP